jgi:hypothetical protein
MKNGWLLAVIVALGLGGCAGLRQFPEVSQNPEKALHDLDAGYENALVQIYGSDSGSGQPQVSTEQQKRIRNKLIETRMAVIDAHYREFEAGLVKENVRADFGIALLGIGVGAAGSLVAETASQILSAVSGGLAGAQAAYGKAVLYDKALSALLAQMHASRKVMAAQISQRWALEIEKYPLWLARTDLEAYYFAGSLPGAILATAADAKTKEAQADVILLRAITPQTVTPEMVLRRAALGAEIDGLDATKAKALVAKIGAEFTEIKSFIDAQYPSDTRAADADGSKAKTVLKRAVVLTVRGPEDADKWQSAIGGL